MNILLIDDEDGIREGLAAFLRLKGYTVRTAGSVGEARAENESDEFDLVISDWNLPDGSAEAIVASCGCPVIAFSGRPEEVVRVAGVTVVLPKPVSPQRLLVEIQAVHTVADPGPGAMPADTADRISLALGLLGEPESVRIDDDGDFVTVSAGVASLPDRMIAQLELIGGDLRVWGQEGALCVELRLCRDGRPEGVRARRSWTAEWDDISGEIVVDVTTDRAPAPEEFLQLLDRVASARGDGHTVHLTNVPSHLRLYAEISGRGHDMPKRVRAGPRLPEVLTRLWS